MKKILLIIIIILFSSFSYANKVPYGVEGTVNNFNNPVMANISIFNTNNNFSISGTSNIGFLGRYSASINGNEEDLIIIKALYNDELLIKNFTLSGIHEINFDFKNSLITEKIEKTINIPDIVTLKINNFGNKKDTKIRLKSGDKVSEWKSIEEFPKNIIAFSIYEKSDVEIKNSDGEIIVKELYPEKEKIIHETINIFDKKLVAFLLLTIISIIIVIVLVIKK